MVKDKRSSASLIFSREPTSRRNSGSPFTAAQARGLRAAIRAADKVSGGVLACGLPRPHWPVVGVFRGRMLDRHFGYAGDAWRAWDSFGKRFGVGVIAGVDIL